MSSQTWFQICMRWTRMMPSPPCLMRKVLLCFIIWRNYWEVQVHTNHSFTPFICDMSVKIQHHELQLWIIVNLRHQFISTKINYLKEKPSSLFLFLAGTCRSLHGLCEVLHSAFCLWQRNHRGMERLSVHLFQRQGEK